MRKATITKNVLAISAVGIAVAIALTGCSSASPQASGASKTYSVTLDLAVQAGCPFCIAIGQGAKAEAKKQGIDLTIVSPKSADTAGQIQQLNGILASPPDLLILEPFDSTALLSSVNQFAQAGVKTITVDSDIADTSARLAFDSSNNVVGGKLAATTLQKLVGSGEVAYFGYTPGNGSTDDRQKGFEAQIKKSSSVTYLGAQYNADDQVKSAGQLSALLASNPNLKGIFAGTEASATGVATALQAAGKTGKVKVVAFDGAPDEVAGLKNGALSVLIVQKAYAMGELAIQQAAAYLKHGTKTKSVNYLGYVQATKENLSDASISTYLYPAN
jgi:ribose transport system substrate-binding protein